MPVKRIALCAWLAVFLAGTGFGQIRDDEVGTVLGPFCFVGMLEEGIDAGNFWIHVDWAQSLPESSRKVELAPGASRDRLRWLIEAPVGWMVCLDQITTPPFSNPEQRRRFNRIYADGLKEILKDRRPFDFEIGGTSPVFQPPMEISAILWLRDEKGARVSVQSEMVRRGFAAVANIQPDGRTENGFNARVGGDIRYGETYRNSLLALQDAAKAKKLGVWAETP